MGLQCSDHLTRAIWLSGGLEQSMLDSGETVKAVSPL